MKRRGERIKNLWVDKGCEQGRGAALVLIIRKTDFHAYYTNDFRIFDAAAGVGRTQKSGRRL